MNEQYDLYCNGILIMELSYKPSCNDVIRNDESGIFYKVTKVYSMKKLLKLLGRK